MKVLMDADCLIKLTKSGLKELVAAKVQIFIPEAVRREVVDAGKLKQCSDALAVEKNIEEKTVCVIAHSVPIASGDRALVTVFGHGNYDAVATDDARLTQQLRAYGIPFVLPGLLIYQLMKQGILDKEHGFSALAQLAQYISEDEYSTTRLLMESIK